MAEPISIATSCLTLLETVVQSSAKVAGFIRQCRHARADLLTLKSELESVKTTLEILADDTKDPSSIALPYSVERQFRSNLKSCEDVVGHIELLVLEYDDNSRTGIMRWVLDGHKEADRLRSSLEAHKSAFNLAMHIINLSTLNQVRDSTSQISNDTSHIRKDTALLRRDTSLIREDNTLLRREILAQFARLQPQLAHPHTNHGVGHAGPSGLSSQYGPTGGNGEPVWEFGHPHSSSSAGPAGLSMNNPYRTAANQDAFELERAMKALEEECHSASECWGDDEGDLEKEIAEYFKFPSPPPTFAYELADTSSRSSNASELVMCNRRASAANSAYSSSSYPSDRSSTLRDPRHVRSDSTTLPPDFSNEKILESPITPQSPDSHGFLHVPESPNSPTSFATPNFVAELHVEKTQQPKFTLPIRTLHPQADLRPTTLGIKTTTALPSTPSLAQPSLIDHGAIQQSSAIRASLSLSERKVLDTKLKCIRKGTKLSKVRSWLEAGADPNSTCDASSVSQTFAIYEAAFHGLADIVDLLIYYGAIVNAPSRGQSATPASAAPGRLPMDYYVFPLQAAASCGNAHCVGSIINAGAQVNAKAGYYGTALQAAAAQGASGFEALRLLLCRGADPNITAGRFYTALQAATLAGHLPSIDLLLERGADPNPGVGGPFGTPLLAAVREGHVGAVKKLRAKGAAVDVKAKIGFVARSALGGKVAVEEVTPVELAGKIQKGKKIRNEILALLS